MGWTQCLPGMMPIGGLPKLTLSKGGTVSGAQPTAQVGASSLEVWGDQHVFHAAHGTRTERST